MNKGEKNKVVVSFASGKGGTGKTSVVLNTAKALSKEITVLDCDVEEPNCHIFLKSDFFEETAGTLFTPLIDQDKCNGCGECARFCERKALVCWGSPPLLFPEMCSGCEGCKIVCPINAISDNERIIGKIEKRKSGNIELISGIMNIGEESPVQIIRKLKKMIYKDGIAFIDAPPGSSCPVVASLLGSDYVVLVAEETPFGLSDLQIMFDLVKKLNIPAGVVHNRKGIGRENLLECLNKFNIPLLLEIPYDKNIFYAYSEGELIVDRSFKYKSLFKEFALRLLNEVAKIKEENEKKREEI
jgi:MinD superfamily P-loop ATPase